jgi:mannosylglycerate hydrolase
MRGVVQAFFVSHTHWDREWYMTREKSRYMLIELMEELFALLEENPGSTFMLDGQTIALQDYLEVKPEKRVQIAALVKEGRLTIGPWNVLPDEVLISGESHIRNFLEGQRQCAELGGSMSVGYLPDSFGHPSQLPQILAGLGMAEIVFWRGLGPDITRTELTWAGRDGTEILGINLPFSYGVAAVMPEDPDAFAARLALKIDMLAPLTDGEVILLMNGVDHVAPQRKFLSNLAASGAKLPGWELRPGTLAEYLAAVRAQRLALPRAEGELRSGCRAYLLGGTISTRMYLKQANYRAELLLEKYAEPLSTIAWTTHGGRYPDAELRHAWKLLLSNLPHDSICGCGVDAVHHEMMQRYGWLEELGRSIMDSGAATVRTRAAAGDSTGAEAPWDGSFAVFNPLLHPRGDLVEGSVVCRERLLRKVNFETGVLEEFDPAPEAREPTGILVRDASGAEIRGTIRSARPEDTMHLSLHTQPEMFRGTRVEFSFPARQLPAVGIAVHSYRLTWDLPAPPLLPAAPRLDNELFAVVFEPDRASLRVEDKRTGQVYRGLHVFQDGGDAGDEYTYSWPARDTLVTLDPAGTSITVEGTAAFPVMVVRGTLKAPARMAPDRSARSRDTVAISIESRISLCPGVPRIDIRTTVRNTAEDHRLRVLFPLGAAAAFASAEGIFSVDDRPVTPRDTSAFASWVEPPSTNPQKTFVSVHAGDRGLAVANRGLPEYEVMSDDQGNAVIALTLLRCVGWLSRPDLLARKGNGGWTLPTPGAQCRGEHVFEYSVLPHHGSWQEAGIVSLAHQVAAPPLVLDLGPGECGGGADGSFVTVDRPEVVLSALKRAEAGDGCTLRLWNASSSVVSAALTFTLPVASVTTTDLAERRGEPVAFGRTVPVTLGPWKIVTLHVGFTGNRHKGRVASPGGPASL